MTIFYYFFHIIYCELQKAKAKGDPVSIADAYRHTKTKGHDGVTWLSEKDKKIAVSLCRINLQLIFSYTFIIYISNSLCWFIYLICRRILLSFGMRLRNETTRPPTKRCGTNSSAATTPSIGCRVLATMSVI